MAEKSLIPEGKFDQKELFLGEVYKDVIAFVKAESTISNPTVETKAGQATIRTTAAMIGSSCVVLEKIRLAQSKLVRAEVDTRLDLIGKNGKLLQNELRKWQAEVRKPLTDLEEQGKTDEWNEAVRVEIIRLHVEAISENRFFDDKRQFAIDKKFQDSEKIRLAAEEKARNDIQAKEDQRIADARRAEREAQEGKELAERLAAQAEQDKKDAAAKAEQDRITAANQAEIDKQNAIDKANRESKERAEQVERERVRKERLEREAKEKKAADLDHVKKINNEILEDMTKLFNSFNSLPDALNQEQKLQKLIGEMYYKRIRNVKIEY